MFALESKLQRQYRKNTTKLQVSYLLIFTIIMYKVRSDDFNIKKKLQLICESCYNHMTITDFLTRIIKIIKKTEIRKNSSKRWAPLLYYLERRAEIEMKIQVVLYSLEHILIMSS